MWGYEFDKRPRPADLEHLRGSPRHVAAGWIVVAVLAALVVMGPSTERAVAAQVRREVLALNSALFRCCSILGSATYAKEG